ncbi:MAG: hypothetical protein GX363_09975 [Clostridiales bacterium]|nr:hypothetical protein [Clostridiales bacterium]
MENHIKVLSNVKAEMPKDIVGNRFGGIQNELDYSEELERQVLEARLFETLTDKRSEGYNKQLQSLMDTLFFAKDNHVKKEKKKEKHLKMGFLKKGSDA